MANIFIKFDINLKASQVKIFKPLNESSKSVTANVGKNDAKHVFDDNDVLLNDKSDKERDFDKGAIQ